MKRDMDLIRKMLLEIESHASGWAPNLEIEGYTPDQIGYHSYLIIDAGLATGDDLTDTVSCGPEWKIRSLTAAGHDFTESARNEFVWNEVQEAVKKKGFVSVGLDVLKKLLDKQLRKLLEVD